MSRCGAQPKQETDMSELSQLVPDVSKVVRITICFVLVLAVGTAIGLQRELTHKTDGLRTHMMVALGTALFVVGAGESGMNPEVVSRIIQGIATGIGFLVAGAILKSTDERKVNGLTFVACVWLF